MARQLAFLERSWLCRRLSWQSRGSDMAIPSETQHFMEAHDISWAYVSLHELLYVFTAVSWLCNAFPWHCYAFRWHRLTPVTLNNITARRCKCPMAKSWDVSWICYGATIAVLKLSSPQSPPEPYSHGSVFLRRAVPCAMDACSIVMTSDMAVPMAVLEPCNTPSCGCHGSTVPGGSAMALPRFCHEYLKCASPPSSRVSTATSTS